MARRRSRAAGPAFWLPPTQQQSTARAAKSEESTDDAAETAQPGNLLGSGCAQLSLYAEISTSIELREGMRLYDIS